MDARATVLREVRSQAAVEKPRAETCPIDDCQGRVLAEDAIADRNYPAFNRATRDGFAVRSGDVPGRLRIIGRARAGQQFDGVVKPGETIEIMTGAPAPEGADAVI